MAGSTETADAPETAPSKQASLHPSPARVQWTPIARPKPIGVPGKALLQAARDYSAPGGLPQRALFNYPVRDPYILSAPDGYFYMVATASRHSLPNSIKSRPDADFWNYNDGIPLWRSKDLVDWETAGYVWTLDNDATWAKEYGYSPLKKRANIRAVWAPEIHYAKGTYWIAYSINYGGTGLLKSASGQPEGPYVDAKADGPINGEMEKLPIVIDPSIFEDTDGTVYYLDCAHTIAKMKPDLSGLAEPPRFMEFLPKHFWGEGVNLYKINGKYLWIGAGAAKSTLNGEQVRTYDCFSATSDSPYGPYSNRSRAIPYAGHNNLFQDKQGSWWSTSFSPQPFFPGDFSPKIIPVQIDSQGRLSAKRAYPRPVWSYTTSAPEPSWNQEAFNPHGWKRGEAGFGDPAIMQSGPITDIGTVWTQGGIWMRQTFELSQAPLRPALFLRHNGPAEVWINGRQVYTGSGALEDYQTGAVENVPLRQGFNIIAVHAQSDSQPAYIDVGLVDLGSTGGQGE